MQSGHYYLTGNLIYFSNFYVIPHSVYYVWIKMRLLTTCYCKTLLK